ncbi:MAG: YgjV family protein [Ferruginibacter sp.]
MLQQIAPYFGYLASICLVLAIVINNDLKFRWFSTLGNIFFIGYAILLSTIPVLITNGILLGINVYYLVKIYRKQENFDLLEFMGDEKLAQKFLAYYQQDIAQYFPSFIPGALKANLNFVVTRDLVIANMFSAKITANGDAYVELNYTLKKFRDYKVGRFIFEKERDYLISKGIKRLVYTGIPHKSHLNFIKVMGFCNSIENGKSFYVKNIS